MNGVTSIEVYGYANAGGGSTTTEVTITNSDFPSWGQSFTKDGVTVSAGMFIDGIMGNIMGGGSFSTTLGNFTKIEVNAFDVNISGEGWSGNSQKMTWTGNASSVSFSGEIRGEGEEVVTLKFTIADPAPTTHTLRLVADSVMGSVAVTNLLGSDIVDNGDGTYTVPENVSVTILATPNEGYEFSGWLEGNVLCDFIDCGTTLNTMDNPLTFTITQDAACKAEFVAVAPSAKYYVVGDMTNWAVNADYEMTPNNVRVDTDEEYKFDITLTTANQFKVVKVEGETQTWYPDGMGNNYGEHGEIERDGDYTIYFRPALDGDDDWFYNCIMAIRHATPERVVVAALFPENGMPTEGVKIFGSFSEEEFDMTLIIETGGYIHSEIMAADQDEFMFRDAADEENVLVVRNAAGQWEEAVFTFDEEWEQDTYKGEPVKMIDMDLSDNSKYAWANAIPEGLEEVQSEKAESRKIMLNGMLYIVRDGKMYNVLGTEMK
jgi:hypothetical protein